MNKTTNISEEQMIQHEYQGFVSDQLNVPRIRTILRSLNLRGKRIVLIVITGRDEAEFNRKLEMVCDPSHMRIVDLLQSALNAFLWRGEQEEEERELRGLINQIKKKSWLFRVGIALQMEVGDDAPKIRVVLEASR